MPPTRWRGAAVAQRRPGDRGGGHADRLPETAEKLGPRYELPVATAMPIPPCLIRLERFDGVQFGFCSTGTESPNLTVDPSGNLRSCNLSDGVLGNIVDEEWSESYPRIREYQEQFEDEVPQICKGCTYGQSCQGGCKERAFATFGEHSHPEPFVFSALNSGWRDKLAQPQKEELDCPGATMGGAVGAAE